MVFLFNPIVGGSFDDDYFDLVIFGSVLILLAFAVILLIFRKKSFNNSKTNLELEQYTFAFDTSQVSTKQVSVYNKIGACIVSLILVLTPLNEIMDVWDSYYCQWPIIF